VILNPMRARHVRAEVQPLIVINTLADQLPLNAKLPQKLHIINGESSVYLPFIYGNSPGCFLEVPGEVRLIS
jgi:hypothetical protein